MDVKLQMKKACYDVIIKEMQPLLDGQKFVAVEDYFKNEKTAVKVSYDEDRQLFILSAAQVTDNEVGEFSAIGQWLFESLFYNSESDSRDTGELLDSTES